MVSKLITFQTLLFSKEIPRTLSILLLVDDLYICKVFSYIKRKTNLV